MAQDIESEFWKEHFTHLQHKNMVRTNAQRLAFEDVKNEIELFHKENPQIEPEVKDTGSYITWEVFITDTIKLRLFFQHQIKGSLMQKKEGDFVKIADAKFPYNPFPEVKEFLSRKDFYLEELAKEKKTSLESNMKNKIAGEFIKAYIQKKLETKPNALWTLEPNDEGFCLIYNQKSYNISHNDFPSQLDSIIM